MGEIKQIVVSRNFKIITSLVPLVSLGLISLSTNYYYFVNSNYTIVYDFISNLFGFSIASILANFHFVYSHKFCLYSKFSLWGILIYIIINVIYSISIFFGVEYFFYLEIFEAVTITVFFILSIIFLIKKIYEKSKYNRNC